MASFNIQWRSSTKKDLRNFPKQEVARIVAAVEQLAEEPFPHGSQKLTGSEHQFRIRVVDYPVVYEVLTPARIVESQRVRHRKEVYR